MDYHNDSITNPDSRSQTADLIEIDNPLLSRQPEQLTADVENFVRVHDLGAIDDLLLRGARIARDPAAFRTIEGGLSDEDQGALEREPHNGLWKQTKELKTVIITCGLGAIVQGWDQASMNSANLGWPGDFGIDSQHNYQGIVQFAVANAAPFLSAAILGAWVSDPLNELLYGRRGAIFVAALFCFFSVIGSAVCHNWSELVACRVLLGIGIGAKASVIPVYAAEVSPTHIRGSLIMNWQLFVAFGMFLGFSANLIIYRICNGISGWRWQLASSCIPAIPLLLLVFVCAESPRFLMKMGNYKKAFKSLCYLNETPLQAARELYYIDAQMEAETRLYHTSMNSQRSQPDIVGSAQQMQPTRSTQLAQPQNPKLLERITEYFRQYPQLFTIPRIYRATCSASVAMIAQQLCGVNILAFYSTTVFARHNIQFKNTNLIALWLGWGFSLTTFVFAGIAYLLIDKRGRRFLLLTTVPFLALINIILGIIMELIKTDTLYLGMLATCDILFAAFYGPGLGPVPFTYSAEVFPLVNRQIGMSFAVCCNMFGAGILAIIVPIINQKYGPGVLFWFFAGFSLVAFVLIFLLMYEPKGVSLEEMHYIFSVDIWKYINYQFRHVLPWAWRYYIPRRDKSIKQPKPAYGWERVRR